MRMSEGEKARSKVGCWPGLRGQDIPQSSELEGPSPQNTSRSSQQLSGWKILEEGSGKIRGRPGTMVCRIIWCPPMDVFASKEILCSLSIRTSARSFMAIFPEPKTELPLNRF